MGLTKVAETGEIAEGKGKAVQVGNKKIALFQIEGKYYAIDDKCTHRGGPLSEGAVDGKTVTCPWHGASFDITSGTPLTPPASAAVSCYPVVVEGSTLKIDLP